MLRGIYSAATGMMFQMQQVNTIANNLANVETNGYKRKELMGSSFGDLLVQFTDQAPGTENVIGTGVKTDGISRYETPGNLVQTSNRFNVAIASTGYFLTRGADGVEKVTRDGDFQPDTNGRLATRSGDLVLGTDRRPILLTGDLHNMQIAEDGRITVGDQQLGTLMVVEPPKIALETQFPLAPPGLPPSTNVSIKQGFLEHSNVNVVTEMVSMMTANRAYGFGQKVISAHDQILQKAANDLGRIS
ncbi:MAG TPA: flagellar hook-basal body protein [Pantanalinema sp.]